MKRLLCFALILSFTIASAQDEVFYHVFQRSFFDSNNDGHGDLKGITQKLDYFEELGVNTILLTPLYVSDFYHNYFAYDFEKIDPEYGTMDDYLLLVKEVHKRKMKIYQDVEMQYVAGTHPWFKDSYNNPKSKYAKYPYYFDDENTKPFWFWGITDFTIYNGEKQQIITVNMNNPEVKDYTLKVLKLWVDPNRDGKFDDGVDGFRLDHMMDNLDNSNKITNLFEGFWSPLLTDLRKTNPKLKIVAEQADWFHYPTNYFTKGNVDYTFAFGLKFEITKFDKKGIERAADSTFLLTPKGKNQLVFIENHDTNRFASEVGMTVEKEKAATAIQLLIGGLPSIYYGQELGMKGIQKHMGNTDGNDIPIREAFDWYASGEGKGMANWYKGTDEWWTKRQQQPNDGISLEEEKKNPGSLWNFYRDVLALRKKHPALRTGKYEKAVNGNDSVLSFFRTNEKGKYLVIVNLSDKQQSAEIAIQNAKSSWKKLYGKSQFKSGKDRMEVNLAGYETLVVRIN
jgi:alpha-amylase